MLVLNHILCNNNINSGVLSLNFVFYCDILKILDYLYERGIMMEKTKNVKSGGFSSRIGFVLAAAGSAVGLGNIWRFPYLAAKYGGGMFLLVYLILAVTFGFTLMIAEISIGRKTGKSALTAYKDVDSRFSFLGILLLSFR